MAEFQGCHQIPGRCFVIQRTLIIVPGSPSFRIFNDASFVLSKQPQSFMHINNNSATGQRHGLHMYSYKTHVSILFKILCLAPERPCFEHKLTKSVCFAIRL